MGMPHGESINCKIEEREVKLGWILKDMFLEWKLDRTGSCTQWRGLILALLLAVSLLRKTDVVILTQDF
jgi:hypothetical protein